MRVYKGRKLNIIRYIGEEPRKARELLINPIPTIEKGDLLVVPEKVARFLSRKGSPFEYFNIEDILNGGEVDLNQVTDDDAVARIKQLEQSNLELDHELKLKIEELGSYELRDNQEIEELKKLNNDLNEKLSISSEAKTSKAAAEKRTKTTKAQEVNS